MSEKASRSPRFRKRIPVRFGITPEMSGRGFTVNVSARGVAVATNSLPKLGGRLYIEFTLGSKSCRAEGQIRWAQRGLVQAGTVGVRLNRADEDYYRFIWELSPEKDAPAAPLPPAPRPLTPDLPVVQRRTVLTVAPPGTIILPTPLLSSTELDTRDKVAASDTAASLAIESAPTEPPTRPPPPPEILAVPVAAEPSGSESTTPAAEVAEAASDAATIPPPEATLATADATAMPEPSTQASAASEVDASAAEEAPAEPAAADSSASAEVPEQLPDYLTLEQEGSDAGERDFDAPEWWEPPEVDELHHRAPRMDASLAIQFGVGVALDRTGTTLNLSATGIAVSVPVPAEPGEMVVFAITSESGVSRGAGQVVWVREVLAEPPETYIGVHIIQGDSRYRALLESLARRDAAIAASRDAPPQSS